MFGADAYRVNRCARMCARLNTETARKPRRIFAPIADFSCETTDGVRISGRVARLAMQVLSQLSYRPEGIRACKLAASVARPKRAVKSYVPGRIGKRR